MLPAFFSEETDEQKLNDAIVEKTDELSQDALDKVLDEDPDVVDPATEQLYMQMLDDGLSMQYHELLLKADASLNYAILDACAYCSKHDILALDPMATEIVGCESLFPGTESMSEWWEKIKETARKVIAFIRKQLGRIVDFFKRLLGISKPKTTVEIALEQLEQSAKRNAKSLAMTKQDVENLRDSFQKEAQRIAKEMEELAAKEYATSTKGNFLLKANVPAIKKEVFLFALRISALEFDTTVDDLDESASKLYKLFAYPEESTMSDAGYDKPQEYKDLATRLHYVLENDAEYLKHFHKFEDRLAKEVDSLKSVDDPEKFKQAMSNLQKVSGYVSDLTRIMGLIGNTYLALTRKYQAFVVGHMEKSAQ